MFLCRIPRTKFINQYTAAQTCALRPQKAEVAAQLTWMVIITTRTSRGICCVRSQEQILDIKPASSSALQMESDGDETTRGNVGRCMRAQIPPQVNKIEK